MLRNISILDSATEIIILVIALSFSCLPNMNKDETHFEDLTCPQSLATPLPPVLARIWGA